ncbi:MAG: mechanosensitive ion channel family protein [Bacteroidota bacterium]
MNPYPLISHKLSGTWGILLSAIMLSFTDLAAQQDTLPQLSDIDTTQTAILPGTLSSPRSTIAQHLIYLQEATYQPEVSALSFDSAGVPFQEVIEIAIQLKQIYDGESYYIDTLQIPSDPNYLDSLGRARFKVFPVYPEIYVTKVGDQWLYSRNTVFHIPKIHDKVFPFGADFLLNISPKIGQKKFWGLKLWQYQGILIILVIALIGYWLFSRGLNVLIRRIIPQIIKTSWLDPKAIRPVARPLSWLLTSFLVFRLYPSLLLPINISGFISVGLKILMSIFGIMAAYRITDLFASISLNLAGNTETTMDDQLIPLVSKLIKLIVGVLGVLFVLQNLQVNVTALLAGISIGGLALALAAQETVKNLISSVTIFLDRPFQIGDFIESGSISGSVVEIGVRSSRLRAPDGAMMSIPNGTLTNLNITNHGVRTYRRYATTLGLQYNTPPKKIEAFVEGARKIIFDHPMTRDKDHLIYFHEMGDSSLNVFVAMFLEITAYEDMLKARQDIFLAILKLAEELGVEFAFPSTSLYLEKVPEGFRE